LAHAIGEPKPKTFSTTEWIDLNVDQQITSRQTHFNINRNNKLQLGMNGISNSFYYLSGKIPLLWLNKNYVQF
jgi:hypothetical protein